MRDVRAQWRHTGTSTDVNHFLQRGLDMEITKRADGGDSVAGFEAEHVGGTDTRRAVLSWRWQRDADVEAEDGFGLRIAGERVVVAAAAAGILGNEI